MADTISKERRSRNMAAIRSKGMKPERLVRSLAHQLGYRFRLHAKDLPGKPDLVFRSKRKAVFVHGCFWHQHDKAACPDARLPKSNTQYWMPKLQRNVVRDAQARAALQADGWKVLVIWDCETSSLSNVRQRLLRFLS